MQYRTLGSTGVRVSSLCFGTMSFGKEADEHTSAAMFARCRERGVNFFDCADIYAGGRSEEILGRLIRPCRDDLIVTSKVGFVGGLSRRNIMLRVEASLRRLGTEYLDIYFCHCDEPEVAVDDLLRSFDDLVRSGKVRYMGVSNWSAWRIARALSRSDLLNSNTIRVLQPMYNLAKRTAEVELLPLASAEKLGVISYSPLAGGLLTGKYARPDAASSAQGRLATNKMYAQRYQQQIYHDIAARFAAHAADHNVHPATLAVAWVKAHPAITAPIIGARNVEQLGPSLAAAEYDLTPEHYQQLCDLTPPVPVATDRDEERLRA